MTTLNEATEAVYKRLVENYSLTPYTFENETYTPPKAESWIRLSIRNIVGNQYTLGKPGNRIYRKQAMVLTQVFIPNEQGRQQSDIIAQAVKDIFEGTTFDGLSFTDSTIRESGTDGQWFIVVVQCNFMYDEQK